MLDETNSLITHKAWGTTELIESNNSFELHRLIVKSGAKCSKHKHKHKWNGFFVEQGSLLIRIWKDNSETFEKSLTQGQYFKISPGDFHQFEALTNVVAYEIYWVQFDPNDIVREI